MAQTLSRVSFGKQILAQSVIMQTAKVASLFSAHVSHLQLSQATDGNIFGASRPVLPEIKKNIPLLTSLVELKLYPRLSEIQSGLQCWLAGLGPKYQNAQPFYVRQQAYAIAQQLHKARKMSHNITTGSRIDGMITPLVELIAAKTAAKKAAEDEKKEKKRRAAAGVLGRKLLRRCSSSPKPPKPGNLTQEQMLRIFGAPPPDAADELLEGEATSPEALSQSSFPLAQEEVEEEADLKAEGEDLGVVDLLSPSPVKAKATAAEAPAAQGSVPFYNHVTGQWEIILPSGAVLPVFEHKSEPGTAQNKAAAKTHCKAKSKASGLIKKRAVHKRPASAQELDDAPVQDLNLYNAHCRQAAYITAKVEGRISPRLLVEIPATRCRNYVQVTEEILKNAKARLSKRPHTPFSELKAMALALRDLRAPLKKKDA